MPILFKPVPKTTSIKSVNNKIYHAKTITNGTLEFEALLKIISKKSNIHYADCMRFFLYFEETLKEELENGKIIRLNELGSLQIGATAKSVSSIDEVTAATITKPHINFRTGKEFKKILETLVFKKVK